MKVKFKKEDLETISDILYSAYDDYRENLQYEEANNVARIRDDLIDQMIEKSKL